MGFAVEAKLQESVSRRDSDSDGTRDKSDKTIPNGNKSTLPMISTTNVTTISNEPENEHFYNYIENEKFQN